MRRPARRRTTVAAGAVGPVVAAVLAVVALAGCGTGPTTTPPSGVDELVVPTPVPDPGDFVGDVDNPWWPLQPGVVGTFRDEDGRELTRTVGAPEPVGGLNAFPVTLAAVAATWPGEVPTPTTEWFAQDRRGNVWLVGGTAPDGTRWRAGEGGPPAGLVVTAVPRVGDGYVRRDASAAPGLPESVVRVLSVGGETELEGAVLDAVVLEETWRAGTTGGVGGVGGVGSEAEREVELARGVGVVRLTTDDATWLLTGLPGATSTPAPTTGG